MDNAIVAAGNCKLGGINFKIDQSSMFLIIVIFMTSMVSGCAMTGYPSGPLPPSTRPNYNLTGYPPAFKEGYTDGCETAKRTSYGRKDEHRYATDQQYRAGWDDSFSLCRGKR